MSQWKIKKLFWGVAAFLLSFGSLYGKSYISDSGHLYSAQIDEYVRPESVEALRDVIVRGACEGKVISFAGQRHSQGGHTFSERGIVVDMRSLNRVIKIDRNARVIVVEAGATWEEVQNAVNCYGLAVKVMQASNIFTVGGSLSVNVHGRDARQGTLIETVRSIEVMKADGSVVNASRSENSDLFKAAIGGYGLFGAITEAEIELTENATYRKTAQVMLIDEYPSYFQSQILNKSEIGLHFARLNLSSNSFMQEVIAVSYVEDASAQCDTTLEPEADIYKNKAQLFLLRNFDFIKTVRWPLEVRLETKEQIVTRNQAMRPPVKCLSYKSKTHTDILQEYFIPVREFSNFAEGLREIAQENGINLLNVTVRYVPKDETSTLPYAKEDSFAFVLYVTQGLSEREYNKAETWTRALIDAALDCKGTYYLPYQLYASKEQIMRAYPEMKDWLDLKKVHDPEGIFSNTFYQTYNY